MLMKKRIVIAEDEELQLNYLKRDILTHRKEKYEIVGEAHNGMELLNLWRKLNPDLLIVDLNMPKMTGGEAIQEIRRVDKKVKIIVLTSLEDEYLINAFLQYTDAYLLKTKETPENFLEKLDEVAFSEKIETRSYLLSKIIQFKKKKIKVTKRQLEIIYSIKQGLQNQQIANKLFISNKTVEKTLKTLFEKFKVDNRHELAAKFDEKKKYGELDDGDND